MNRDASTLNSLLQSWKKLPIEEVLKPSFYEKLQTFGVHKLVLQSIAKSKSLSALELYIKEVRTQSLNFKKNAQNPKLVRLLHGPRH